ncbi:MAG: hypothetical protein WCG19_06905 [Chlorobiaceae bacterium]
MKVSSSGFTGEELARYWHSYKKSLSAQQISECALYVDYVNAVVDMVKDNYFTPPPEVIPTYFALSDYGLKVTKQDGMKELISLSLRL